MDVDNANKSYAVNMIVPAGYKIIIANNVYNLTCKSGLTTKLLDNKEVVKEVDDKAKLVTFTTDFSTEEAYMYNYLLDRADVTINELFLILLKANTYFSEYEITCKSLTNIDKYINTLSRYQRTWTGLTSKPDYNLTIFTNRTLPYFSLECMDWVKANIDALQSDYPAELAEARKQKGVGKNTVTDEYHEEISLVTKNNNFLEWHVLPVDKYPDMSAFIIQIRTLMKLKLKRQALSMICRLLLSPRECHIIKYQEIWNILKPELAHKDYDNLVKYCMFYSMYILKQEETIMFSQINTKSRILFTLDEAHALPTFDGCHIDRSPYIVQLTNDTPLGQTMLFYLQGSRSINSDAEFRRRLDIATGGAFKGVNFKSIGAAITGSILLPCAQRSPLEDGFNDVEWNRTRNGVNVTHPYMIDEPTTKEDIAFANYLEYYYPSYVSLTDEDYKKQVLGIGAKLNDNEQLLNTAEQAEDVLEYEIVTGNSAIIGGILKPDTVDTGVIVTKKKTMYEENTVLDPATMENKSQRNATEYNQLADIDISITTNDVKVFKERALALYEVIKNNCAHRGLVHIKEVKTIASLKYKVYGPGIPRPMDIFRIPYDPAKMVKKFHVNAVKMFYNDDLTLLRSCVSCLLSGVGETYKWFSCNKIPADVLLKYAQRGFSIILNTKERDAISNYIMASERWGNIVTKLNIDSKKIYCCTTKNHPFFRPGIYGCGIRYGLRSFERDCDKLYTNTLVVEKPTNVYSYGEVVTHDNKKIYMPNAALINAVLDHIDNESVVTDSFDNIVDLE